MIIAITIGVLAAGGVFLVLQRGMVRLILGMTLIGHAANLTLLAAGIGAWRSEPLMHSTNPTDAADPLPQAFVLTAIVISMATTAFMLTLAALGRNDDTMTDPMKTAPDPYIKDPAEAADADEDADDAGSIAFPEKDYFLPESQSQEVNALQTMGRRANRISRDSHQWDRRQKRQGGKQ